MQADKLGHALAGAMIADGALIAANGVFGVSGVVLAGVAVGAAALAGALKEARDWITGRGHVEALDFVATAGGGVLVALAVAQLEGGLF